MMNKVRGKLVLIDAHALIHRAYHALPPMNAPDGRPTNAVYGFVTALLKVVQQLRPDYVIAAFDMPGPTFRHIQFEEYKAQRKSAEPELVSQFEIVRQVAEVLGIPIKFQAGFEADDVIGSLVKQAEKQQAQVVIVTGDADELQLVSETVGVYMLKRGVGEAEIYNKERFKEKYGFRPENMVDFKGLRGDTSDNIPGVKGIGEKTSLDLIGQYGALEQVFKHLDELPKRVQTRLRGQEEQAVFSRDLATIRTDVPLEIDWEESRWGEYDIERARALFLELGFKSLVSKLPQEQRDIAITQKVSPRERWSGWRLANTLALEQELHRKLKRQTMIAFDTETDGLGARVSPIIGMSFAFLGETEEVEAWYVPVDQESAKKWKDVLEDSRIKKTGHNLKYDWQVMRQAGVELRGIAFDSILASYVLYPGKRQYGLDEVALTELGHTCIPITDLIGTDNQNKSLLNAPLEDVAAYAAEDAWVAWQLYKKLSVRIEEEKLGIVLNELEVPLVPVLAAMELEGVKLDREVLERLKKKVETRLQKLVQEIWSQAGEEFNVNSTKQLRYILFDKIQLPTTGIARKQSGYSTAAAELAKLEGQHPIIGLIQEQRELSKLLSTYIVTLPELADKETGRVYTSFNQTVTATGRLSSSDPNLQNIPARTELGQEIRAAFIAPEGKVLIKADYSQLELRIAAHVSGDEKMKEAFRQGEDIHRATAAWVHGIELQEVTDQQRRAAKTLNFGVLYGMGPMKFARETGLSVEEARSFIERYHKQYSGITMMIERMIEQAQAMGYTETIFGRRRYFPEMQSSRPGIRAQAERAAYNFPLQGTAADILKKAMIKLATELDQQFSGQAQMVLTVHDELVVEAEQNIADQVKQTMKEVMENVVVLDVPLEVDVGSGKNWQKAKG